jgi:hypothetical protein
MSKRQGAIAVHKLQKEKQSGFWCKATQEKLHTALSLDKVFRAEDQYVWSYKGTPVFCTINCRLTSEVLNIIRMYDDRPMTSLGALVKGKRKTVNGWSVEKII